MVIGDHIITLWGADTIIGRSFVVHADVDDLGKGGHELSSTTGSTSSCYLSWLRALALRTKGAKVSIYQQDPNSASNGQLVTEARVLDKTTKQVAKTPIVSEANLLTMLLGLIALE